MDMSKPLRCMQDHFSVGKELGEGAYAVVHEVHRKPTSVPSPSNISRTAKMDTFAAKVYDKDGYDETGKTLADALQREVGILNQLVHPNIVALEGLYEDKECYYMVSEVLKGGDLFDLLVDNGKLDEDDVKITIRTLLGALKYCHSKNISHSDIKLDNIMLLDADNDQPTRER